MAIQLPNYSGTNFKFENSPWASRTSSVGGIISSLLPYIFVFAGLGLLLMLIWGGITLMTSAGNVDKTKAGYGRIIQALIGFVIIFISFFVLELVGVVFGIKITNFGF